MERRKFKKAPLLGVVMLLGLTVCLAGQTAEDLAELYVQKIVLEPPSPATRGEDVVVLARIMNTGRRTADRFDVGLFYRPQREGESWTLKEKKAIEHLPPSQQDFCEVNFAFETLNWELGTYEIRVVADLTNEIPEIDELNNALQTSLALLPSRIGLSDLQPVKLSFTPTDPSNDMFPWEMHVTVSNTGDKDAGEFKTVFRIEETGYESCLEEGSFEGECHISDALLAKHDQTFQMVLDPTRLGLKPGTYHISVIVDKHDQIPEQDKANNVISGALTIQALELHPISLEFDKAIIHLDEEVKVSSEIKNVGEDVAEKVEVAFYANHLRFATTEVGPVSGLDVAVVAEGILDPEKVGFTHAPTELAIRVVVDPDNLLHEWDEANNELVRSLTVLEPAPKMAELHPESLELSPPSPAEARKAGTVTVSTVIKNTGNAAAEAFSAHFAYRVKGALRWEPFSCGEQATCTDLALAPNEELKLVGTLPVSLLTPGIYEIKVGIDPMGTIEELDETNNELATTLTLLSSRLPDLTFDPSLPPVEVLPSNVVKRGQTLRFVANLINLGDESAGAFEVQFAYSRVPEGVDPSTIQPTDYDTFWTAYVPELGVGERTKVEAVLETTINLDPGTYYIQVEIDPPTPSKPMGDVLETDEVNNVVVPEVLIQGVDLMAADLSIIPSSTVVQGEAVDLLATVINLGVEPAGDFCVSFLGQETQPGVTGPSDYPVRYNGDCTIVSSGECDLFGIGGVKFLGLDVGKAETVRCALETAVLDPGVYQIFVHVDPDDSVKEQYETNNQFFATLVIQPRPADLRPEPQLTFIPEPPIAAGDPVEIHAEIANDGGTVAEESQVAFIIREVKEEETPHQVETVFSVKVNCPRLEPGQSEGVIAFLDTRGLKGTTYQVCVVADADETVPEMDEKNNAYCVPPPFTFITLPGDLHPLCEIDFVPLPPYDIDIDKPVAVKIFAKVENTGDSPLGRFLFKFLYRRIEEDHEGDQYDVVAVDGLAPGETKTVSTKHTFAKPGTYEICLIADPDNLVDELDEENNAWCTPPPFIVIGPGQGAGKVDLVPVELAFQPSTSVPKGQKVTISATVTNQGSGPAGRFAVKFFRRETQGTNCDLGGRLFAVVVFGEGLEAGEKETRRVWLRTTNARPGDHIITAVVDADEQIAESNEENNQITRILIVDR